MIAVASTQTLDTVLEYWRLSPIEPERRMPVEISGVGREDLARLFQVLGFTRGAEIGVQYGEFSETLCQANPALQLLCVDPWTVRADYDNGRDTQADFDAIYHSAVARLAPYPVEIVRATSLEAVARVPEGSLDFVYIDGHHNFQNVTHDICAWTKKVRLGGMIAGHDYYKSKRPVHGLHVQHVVDAVTEAYGIRPWFVLGRKSPAVDERRDRHRSFFWIKTSLLLDHGR